MSRSLWETGLLLATVLLASPLSAHATEHQNAGAHVDSPARSHERGNAHARNRCTLQATAKIKAKAKVQRGSHVHRRSAAMRTAACVPSSALDVHRSHVHRPTNVLKQFKPHSVGDIFGVGSFVTQRSWTISSLMVRRASQLGMKWVREEFTASRLHAGTSGRYSWADYDRIVNQERRAKLQVLGLLDYSNTWSYHDHGTMPHRDMRRLIADFARYVHDVVRHFRGRVSYWEIWNEPNVGAFWHPTPDPSDYASLLTAAGSAVKHADRRAKIVLAGTSGIDLAFIRAVAAHTHSFDVIAVHPYRRFPEPSFLMQVRALRGLHKPIWFSEIGWPAGDGCERCYGEVEQARYLVRFYALAAAAGIQRVFWYDLRDDPHRASDPEAHFGLLRRDLSGKPAFVAYAYLSRLLDGSRYGGADWLGQHGLYTLRFRRRHTDISVVWNASDQTRQLRLKWSHPEADFINSAGVILAQLTPVAGHVTVIAPQGGEPFYLVEGMPAYRVPAHGALLHFAPFATRMHPRKVRTHVRTTSP